MLIDHAIELIALIEKKEAEYRKVNDEMRRIQGDFSSHIEVMNEGVFSGVVNLLDEIIGDELASYYLFECRNMKDGGAIHDVDGVVYKIRNIDDVKAYMDAMAKKKDAVK